MAAPHQGAYFLVNAPVPPADPHPGQAELEQATGEPPSERVGASGRRRPRHELSGVARAYRQGAQSGVVVATTPIRISALLHEAAAEGVIPRLKPVHRQEESRRFFAWRARRHAVAEIRGEPRNRGDGGLLRMTPTQRK